MKNEQQLLELLSQLEKDYTPEPLPPCPVCGSPRTRICAGGGGRITYCCSSDDADPMGKGPRFDECMDHFSKSRVATVARDNRVLRLCAEVRKLLRNGR